MTRPAVIIGLGGTGQWVLTFVKKDLLEVGQGTLPKNVALLSFDTMPQATAETERQGGAREVRVGSVRLETDQEFIHVGGNAFRLSQEVRDGRHAHIGSWFHADHYIRTLPPAAFNLSEGAGQIRQFGRLAIFHDLAQPAESSIWPNVYSAVQSVRASVSDETALEVIIVGSFAGGTGAGMFIDMALLLRGIASEAVAGNHIVRGFFVLPRAFPVAQGRRQNEMFARTFGAWRELNRFMLVDPELGLRKMIYHERERDFQVNVEKRLYDVCYLIDSRGALASSNPEKGVFPSISDAISAILDTEAGQKYTEHVTSNLARAFARHPGQPMYSTVGTYAVKVPVYYVQQEFAHQLSLRMLDKVLAPIRDERGHVTQLAPNANPENPAHSGADGVYSFLEQSSFSRAGEATVYNTLFMPKIAELMKADAELKQDIQKTWADASLHARRGASPVGWDTPLAQLGDSPEALALRGDVDRIVQLKLVVAVPPSRTAKDSPVDAIARLHRQVPKFKIDQVGVREMTEKETTMRGNFGKVLETCKGFQNDVFQRMLRLWLLNTLEGQVEDPLIARSGKIGYADAFLTELVNVLDRFLTYMRKVKRIREELGLANSVAADVTAKRNAYVQRANRKKLLDTLTKGDYEAQERYLEAEQRAIWLRQDEILHEVVEETAQAMLVFARRARDEVRSWIATLALNPDSILRRVETSLDDVEVAHQNDRNLSNVQQLLADEARPVTNELLQDALGRLHWSVDRLNGALTVGAALEMAGKSDLRSNTRDSVQTLLRYSSERFPGFQEKAVAVEMDRLYESDANRVSAALHTKAEPLTSVRGNGPEERHCYIRVHNNINERVKVTFDNALTTLKGLNKGISMNLVESEDPYKLTMVRSNDMIRPEDFTAWEECQGAYETLVHDEPDQAMLLQTFPAEVIAAKYERKLDLLRANWRVFHPRVVMLLEDETRLRQFLQAWAYGFIRQEKDPRTSRSYYELVISNSSSPAVQLTDPEKQADVFVVMNQFLLKGQDVRREMRQSIRYDWLQEAIHTEQAQLGALGAADSLEYQITNKTQDPKGFVVQQRERADALDRETPGGGQAFRDLADLAELVLRDMISELRS